MNKQTRLALSNCISDIEVCKTNLEDLMNNEECAKDSLEEYFSETERYEIIENNVDLFQLALDNLDGVIEYLADIE